MWCLYCCGRVNVDAYIIMCFFVIPNIIIEYVSSLCEHVFKIFNDKILKDII